MTNYVTLTVEHKDITKAPSLEALIEQIHETHLDANEFQVDALDGQLEMSYESKWDPEDAEWRAHLATLYPGATITRHNTYDGDSGQGEEQIVTINGVVVSHGESELVLRDDDGNTADRRALLEINAILRTQKVGRDQFVAVISDLLKILDSAGLTD